MLTVCTGTTFYWWWTGSCKHTHCMMRFIVKGCNTSAHTTKYGHVCVGKYLVTWCLSHTNESKRQLCHKSSIILLLLLRHILCSLPISCHRCDPPLNFWGWWEDLATSQWFSNSLIKPPFIHTIEHLTQPCLWANQTKLNKHTEQTQMTGHSLTCSQAASSLKGKNQ